MKKIILIAAFFGLIGCTDNVKTSIYGGSQTIHLKPGQRLENITWKSVNNSPASLWILTRERKVGELPETHEFSEKSSLGIMQGIVTIVEH